VTQLHSMQDVIERQQTSRVYQTLKTRKQGFLRFASALRWCGCDVDIQTQDATCVVVRQPVIDHAVQRAK
jgi:hypothetical protein